jgi:Putative F0F1-ATPase subunit Ca2+/Mg2+ transporter
MLHKMPKQPFNTSFLKYAGMASQMAIIILVFVGIGRYLDGENGKSYTLIGSILGVGLSLYAVVKSLMKPQ